MKRYLNRFLVLSSCAMVMASCEENSWNDELDGFDGIDKDTATQTIDFTMSATDYTQLAKLSTAKALAGDEHASALSSVGSKACFNAEIDPEEYIPLFLSQPTFPYFSANNGTAVRVTYRTSASVDPVSAAVSAAKKYTVTTEDYQNVWDSTEDYTEAFTPSKTAARNIPGILKTAYPDAAAGQYVIVSYNNAETDPVFSAAPADPFTSSSVLGNLNSMSNGDAIEFSGVVMAVSTQGPIVADATGSVFVYSPANNSDLKLGDQVVVSSTLSSYNFGYQIARGAEAEVKGNQSVSYPKAKTWTATEIDEFVANAMESGASPITPVYSKFTGKVSAGKYINIIIDGTNVQVSPYGLNNDAKALLVDGETVTFEGYVIAIASYGKYFNTIITKIGDTQVKPAVAAMAESRVAEVASTKVNAVYTFDGSTWSAPADITILSHADYQAMGQSYDNLSGTTPETMLPIYMKQKFPYAVADDSKYVVFYYYNGDTNVIRCDHAVFNGSEWDIDYDGVTTVTGQYVKKNGKWLYSPDVTINLPAAKGNATSTLFYQTCVDWVKANVENGAKYVTSYGNNDYYTGASAYQNNIDLRPDKARAQYEEGYAGMTDDQIVALEKKRFEDEVCPAVLSILYPEAAPTSKGIEPLYTINFYYYTGTTTKATIVYRAVALGQFEFVSCTWND